MRFLGGGYDLRPYARRLRHQAIASKGGFEPKADIFANAEIKDLDWMTTWVKKRARSAIGAKLDAEVGRALKARISFKEHVSPELRETIHSNFVSFALVTACEGGELVVEVTRSSRVQRLKMSLSNYEISGWIGHEIVSE